MTLLFFFAVSAQAGGPESPLKKASFIPQWVPQAQFAGYYLAYEKGIYKKYGIDLTIIPGGPGKPPNDLLKAGSAQFATLWLSTGIKMRAEGTKIVNIAQIIQRSALMFVAKKSSGITYPEDMNEKKVGLWGPIFQIQPKAFFKKYDLEVDVLPQAYSVNLFLRGGVDVASAMWYNEYHTILASGINPDELTTFFFYEHGLNFPEDGIYTLEETYQKDPDFCRAFVEASIEGWKYAFSHPEEALAVVKKNQVKSHVPATYAHQRWMLEKIKCLVLGADVPVAMGTLLPEDYYRVAKGLKDNRLIKEIPPYTSFYRKCIAHD